MLPEVIYFGDMKIPVELEEMTPWTPNLSASSDSLSKILIGPSLSAEAKRSHLFVRMMDFVYWHSEIDFDSAKKYLVSTLIYATIRDNLWLLDEFEMASVKSVRILGRQFSVELTEPHDAFKGKVLSASFEIEVRKGNSFRDMKQTLLHEILHSILNVAQWPGDDEDYEADNTRLTRALMFLMGQNDLSWMAEEGDEQE